MQIAIIQTEAADFVKINICVILKTFGHNCILFWNTTIILKAWKTVNSVIKIYFFQSHKKHNKASMQSPYSCHSKTYSIVCLPAENLCQWVCVGYLPLPL